LYDHHHVCSSAIHAQTWVVLSGKQPAPPEIIVTQSDNRQVSFTINLPGFYETLISEAGVDYQRLTIPDYGTIGITGEPEIPVITQRIAIPKCSRVNYTVTVTATQTLQGYRIYPVPDYQPNSEGFLEEVFTINAAAYLQNGFTPGADYTVTETGAMRSQHFVTLNLNPIQFNPVTGQLQMATEMEVTLTFDNPASDVNANLGPFSKTAAAAFLNYQGSGNGFLQYDRAFEKVDFVPGKVKWITIEDPAQADTISCNYLIVTVSEFFTPQNAYLKE
jgi:hypothetical protein